MKDHQLTQMGKTLKETTPNLVASEKKSSEEPGEVKVSNKCLYFKKMHIDFRLLVKSPGEL